MAFPLLYLIAPIVSCAFAANAPFSDSQIKQMRGYFEKNIGVSGCHDGFVVASPSGGKDHNSGDPDYYYHWMRDAAISMHTLQYTASKDSDFDDSFKNYVKWIQKVQSVNDPNGIDVLGEPKFECDGSVYSGAWCRPQNDGPASRAIALISYANYLLDRGTKNDIDYVTTNLFTKGDSPSNTTVSCNVDDSKRSDCGYIGIDQNGCEQKGCCWKPVNPNPNNEPWCFHKGGSSGGSKGAIPLDLDYVTSVWQNGQSCDLWEEVRGNLFYTMMVQRYALYYGASLAKRLNDTASATNWENVASTMDDQIKSFIKGGTIQDMQRQWDCSVIVGTLYGGTPDAFMKDAPEMFPPTDKDVLNTMSQLKSFWDETYVINAEDDTNNIPGTLIGRYANDVYSGCKSNGGSKGHAWILCTNALADVYYRNAMYLHQNRHNAKEVLSAEHLEIYANLFEKDQPKASDLLRDYAMEWRDNEDGVRVTDIDYVNVMETVAQIAGTQGDNQLMRVKHHVQNTCNGDYHLSEQICEGTAHNGGGKEVGAHDLTWSYGTILSALHYRTEAVKSGLEFWPNERPIDDMVLAVAKYRSSQKCGEKLCNSQCSD